MTCIGADIITCLFVEYAYIQIYLQVLLTVGCKLIVYKTKHPVWQHTV